MDRDAVIALCDRLIERRRCLDRKGKTIAYMAMDAYVVVPNSLREQEDLLVNWFARSVEFARALKPKPTKKKN